MSTFCPTVSVQPTVGQICLSTEQQGLEVDSSKLEMAIIGMYLFYQGLSKTCSIFSAYKHGLLSGRNGKFDLDANVQQSKGK